MEPEPELTPRPDTPVGIEARWEWMGINSPRTPPSSCPSLSSSESLPSGFFSPVPASRADPYHTVPETAQAAADPYHTVPELARADPYHTVPENARAAAHQARLHRDASARALGLDAPPAFQPLGGPLTSHRVEPPHPRLFLLTSSRPPPPSSPATPATPATPAMPATPAAAVPSPRAGRGRGLSLSSLWLGRVPPPPAPSPATPATPATPAAAAVPNPRAGRKRDLSLRGLVRAALAFTSRRREARARRREARAARAAELRELSASAARPQGLWQAEIRELAKLEGVGLGIPRRFEGDDEELADGLVARLGRDEGAGHYFFLRKADGGIDVSDHRCGRGSDRRALPANDGTMHGERAAPYRKALCDR
ncbi:hypothetical protein GGR56DRAFT_670592 [Xylariaceae sp. FL0804]|nr:hypothetical protein GGR56DRAFT_670592 [Xylariaceae sp. FL0804]